ncbi:MAG: RNA polymerase sigma factor [Clostridiales bacterium]|nr:RNA polymerase sigma factor [Clostridiales bacterium]
MDEFEALYTQHFQSVFRYALSLCRDETTAEDITSETFLKAIKAIDKFKGDCSVRAWLCQIAKNTYFSLLKKTKREVLLDPEVGFEAESGIGAGTGIGAGAEIGAGIGIGAGAEAPDFTEKLLDRASAFEIHRCLRGLEEPYKEVFSLRTFGELSFAEIAELFGKTETWARVTCHRAKLKLKEALR